MVKVKRLTARERRERVKRLITREERASLVGRRKKRRAALKAFNAKYAAQRREVLRAARRVFHSPHLVTVNATNWIVSEWPPKSRAGRKFRVRRKSVGVYGLPASKCVRALVAALGALPAKRPR